jgi:hypothetical protein
VIRIELEETEDVDTAGTAAPQRRRADEAAADEVAPEAVQDGGQRTRTRDDTNEERADRGW